MGGRVDSSCRTSICSLSSSARMASMSKSTLLSRRWSPFCRSLLWRSPIFSSYVSQPFFSASLPLRNRPNLFFSGFASASFLAPSISRISSRWRFSWFSGSGSSISVKSSLSTSQPTWRSSRGMAARYAMCPFTMDVTSTFSRPGMSSTAARPATREMPPLVARKR